MTRLLLLLLLALPTLAQTPPREPFPSDYKPLACAPKDVCKSFDRPNFARWAGAHRKLPIHQAWVNAHWDEMLTAFRPVCAKIGNCISVPGNDWVYCTDFMRGEFLATNPYPKGTDDNDQWNMSALVFFIGLDNALMAAEPIAQKCALEQRASEERTLEVWTSPAKIGPGYDGLVTIYAVDAETRIPVKAHITLEGQALKPADASPDGHAMSHYKFPWALTLNPVPNADGHRDLVVPTASVKADGYAIAKIPMPFEVPRLILEMQPPASKLVRGKNTVTITARDATTGEPVELRVMAGTQVVGKSNQPLTLEITRKRPEIWVTSLFNRYSDVVVAKAE